MLLLPPHNARHRLCFFFLLWITTCQSSDIDLTVEIPPGKQECFFQNIPANVPIEIDYQVIDGGDLDINVMLTGPDNRILHSDLQRTDNVIRLKGHVAGDYKVCFDNSYSLISTKVVYFEIFVDGEDDEDGGLNSPLTFDGEDMQELLDMTVEDFTGILDRAKKNLERSMQVQTLIRIHEAKDRNTQEANYNRVNMMSCVQLAVMVSVAVVQVAMIRNLFLQKSSLSGSSLKQRT